MTDILADTHVDCVSVKIQWKNPPRNQPGQINQKTPQTKQSSKKNHAGFSGFKNAPQKLIIWKARSWEVQCRQRENKLNPGMQPQTSLFPIPLRKSPQTDNTHKSIISPNKKAILVNDVPLLKLQWQREFRPRALSWKVL